MSSPDRNPGQGASLGNLSPETIAALESHVQAGQGYFAVLKEAMAKGEPAPTAVIGNTRDGITEVVKK